MVPQGMWHSDPAPDRKLSKIRRGVVRRTPLFGFHKAICNIYFTMRLKTRRAIGKRRARCSWEKEAKTTQATEVYIESKQRIELCFELCRELCLELRNDNDREKFVIQID
jgi:hypothetical protein